METDSAIGRLLVFHRPLLTVIAENNEIVIRHFNPDINKSIVLGRSNAPIGSGKWYDCCYVGNNSYDPGSKCICESILTSWDLALRFNK